MTSGVCGDLVGGVKVWGGNGVVGREGVQWGCSSNAVDSPIFLTDAAGITAKRVEMYSCRSANCCGSMAPQKHSMLISLRKLLDSLSSGNCLFDHKCCM